MAAAQTSLFKDSAAPPRTTMSRHPLGIGGLACVSNEKKHECHNFPLKIWSIHRCHFVGLWIYEHPPPIQLQLVFFPPAVTCNFLGRRDVFLSVREHQLEQQNKCLTWWCLVDHSVDEEKFGHPFTPTAFHLTYQFYSVVPLAPNTASLNSRTLLF